MAPPGGGTSSGMVILALTGGAALLPGSAVNCNEHVETILGSSGPSSESDGWSSGKSSSWKESPRDWISCLSAGIEVLSFPCPREEYGQLNSCLWLLNFNFSVGYTIKGCAFLVFWGVVCLFRFLFLFWFFLFLFYNSRWPLKCQQSRINKLWVETEIKMLVKAFIPSFLVVSLFTTINGECYIWLYEFYSSSTLYFSCILCMRIININCLVS